jgi:single-strand DNA-binding protein
MYLNKAMVYGNLTRDPETKALPSGAQVCSLSLATNRTYNDRDGKRQEEVQYHNVVLFGKTAENVAKYMTKGSALYVEGRLQTQSWEKDGVKHYRTEIVGETVQFGPKAGGAPTNDQNATAGSVVPDYPTEDINPEDIPF